MNKRKANEIKKLFTSAGCAITRIYGYYVDSEKNKETEPKETFLSLQEEEAFRCLTIFRNIPSGTVGKNLINMEFPLHTETEGGTQHFLLKLRNSQLRNGAILEELYDKVIAAYDYDENYYIIPIHCAYDIPTKAADGIEVFDASDYVYELIQYTVYPIKLSKAGLCYNSLTDTTENRDRDWLVETPARGLLFPAFSDKNTSIHSLLYYAKNPEELLDTLIDELLGYVIPMSAKGQKETFRAIVKGTPGENCDSEVVKNIRENLNELVEETRDKPIPLTLNKYQVKKLLEISGASPEKLEEFEQKYAEVEEDSGTGFMAANVVNTRSFETRTPDISIKVSPDKAYLVENRVVDGQPCIVIAINEYAEINGIAVRPVATPKTDGDEDRNAQVPF